MELADTYSASIFAAGAMATLMLLQVLVVDVVGITSGHKPGHAIEADHDKLVFRVSRTVANTNESIAVFILGLAFCLLVGASPTYTAAAAWLYVASRALYALFYYGNIKLARSISFGFSLVALLALVATGFFG